SAPVRYELVGREWVVVGGARQDAEGSGQWSVDSGQQAKTVASGEWRVASEPQPANAVTSDKWRVTSQLQQQRPTYTPPAAPRPMPMPQAPRPVAMPPRPGVTPPVQTPIRPPVQPIGQPIQQNPVRPVSPPIARVPGQSVPRFPIAQPPAQRIPIQPIGRPAVPVTPPILHVPGQPVMHFPMVRPPFARVRMPGAPVFHPVVTPTERSPLFHPAATLPGRMPIRRIGVPMGRGPLAFASEAPPIRRVFDGMSRHDAPFIVATARPPHFDVRPCFQTITNCGFGFGFDGDFDFDDGFFFGFPFGSPFFFGPFGFPAFGFGFGPNCFFNGIVEPCGFTPLGFAQFQAFGPNGWGWSWLGLGNGWFYSPPEAPSAPPWNSTETNPGVNLQYFTNEWYLPVPYSEPEAGAAPEAGNEQGGAEQNQNVVTEIVTTDDLVFGVTSYWIQDNQLCYVTTYKIKNCIPMSRVDLQKTVDMNYKRGVKFTLAPKAADSEKQPQPPDEKQR
ncbi:MAG TPA: hypothetical protein VFU57_10410, partial [Candidatus Acidoferrales bacterium]|nr:hypothetical protein [Candidatus Acidoferrales bacterium]